MSAFAEMTSGYRTELLVHCYRMVGSVQEAEDLVQETYLRAWRSFERFEGRSSVRTYLYRIATNACLSLLAQRKRRIMPSALPADGDPLWLEPIPDALLVGDPAVAAQSSAGIRLAFVAALQHLPPVRRAALILRDVLMLSAAETAEVLDTTPAAVNTALLRARKQMAEAAPRADDVGEPDDRRIRMLLDRYVTAFEAADLTALGRLMREDIALEMPPLPAWYRGRDEVLRFLGERVLDEPGRFRLSLTSANGRPGILARLHDHDDVHAVHLPTWSGDAISHLAIFLDPMTGRLFDKARSTARSATGRAGGPDEVGLTRPDQFLGEQPRKVHALRR
ncbi:RNA polymerase subunit sigma-70 [Actinoplanes sp. NPDC051861]|uniref:RNA polymerase subunit sigma-70 n=1 Tax=Actinoplanes sp. NPDC051861 TaxID=3155170 RepID=UPI00342247C0